MNMMASKKMMFVGMLLFCLSSVALAEDPYHFFTWDVTYGTISPLGVPQQGILINGQFPGPKINCTSNNNIVVNVFNHLDEPFLLTWAGVQHRKNSWQDGTPGTMCPIMPGTNYTYKFQVKDQIGTYLYYPSTALHRASGGIGMLKIHSRELIPVPFDWPTEEFEVLLGDWYNKGHKTLKRILDSGRSINLPDGIHINGNKSGQPLSVVEPGKTYRYRVCNVGLKASVNFRIQGHTMKLVEVEGSHTVQNSYDSLDLHVGQCLSVLVTADQAPADYYFVVSSRFLKKPLTSMAVIRYANGGGKVVASSALPSPPPEGTQGIAWSMNQFRSFRWNLTASAARPNPQGSYHYGKINITRTIKLSSSRGVVDGKLRYGINGVSHVNTQTPLKLAEYFGLAEKVFSYGLVKDDEPPSASSSGGNSLVVAPSVVNGTFRNFVEIIFENTEHTIQSYHLDGYSFFAVAIEAGRWSEEKRKNYNLLDAVSRHTVHVYPGSWAAVLTTLDNAGMWNLRSNKGERCYLGQQLYLSVVSPNRSLRDEYNLPLTQLTCGIVKGLPDPAPYV